MALHVIFGTGPVGKATARTLLAAGHAVRMVSRSGKVDGVAGAEAVKADAYDRAQAEAAAQGAVAVYQCAQPAYHQWPELFPPLQASIMSAAAKAGARFIVVDNLYGYGEPAQGQSINLNMAQKATTRKGQVRAAMAQTVLQAHQRGEVRAAIARASNFMGGEYALIGDLIIKPALEGKTVNMIGRLDVPHSFTYVPDFGRALAALGSSDDGLGQAWIVPTMPALTQQALLDKIAALIGKPVKARTAGKLMLQVLGLFNPAMRETVEMFYEFDKPFVVDSSAFESRFNQRPTALDTALVETVAAFRKQYAL